MTYQLPDRFKSPKISDGNTLGDLPKLEATNTAGAVKNRGIDLRLARPDALPSIQRVSEPYFPDAQTAKIWADSPFRQRGYIADWECDGKQLLLRRLAGYYKLNVSGLMANWFSEWLFVNHGPTVYSAPQHCTALLFDHGTLVNEIDWQFDPSSTLTAVEQHERFLQRWQGAARIPTVSLGLVPIVNVAGVDAQRPLKLTGLVLADIYLGKITNWRAPAIAALNQGLTLPDQAIQIIHQFGVKRLGFFSMFLSSANPEWEQRRASDGQFPPVLGLTTHDDDQSIIVLLKRTPGSIGYVHWKATFEHDALPVQLTDVMPGSPNNNTRGFVLPKPARTPLGRFRYVRDLGRGKTGRVFVAHDPLADRNVAVKTIRKTAFENPVALLGSYRNSDVGQVVAGNSAPFKDPAKLLSRFRIDAEAAMRLDHPNIVKILECGESDEYAFMATELAEGEPLKTLLEDKISLIIGPGAGRHIPGWRFQTGDCIGIVCEILDALDHAHGHGVLHLDITPANIFVGSISDIRVKVADFGTATIKYAMLNRLGAELGPYKPIEQHRGWDWPLKADERWPIDQRADVYACGAILFHLLTNLDPGPVKPSSINPYCSPALDPIVGKAMAVMPIDRFQSAREFAYELRRILPDAIALERGLRTAEWKREEVENARRKADTMSRHSVRVRREMGERLRHDVCTPGIEKAVPGTPPNSGVKRTPGRLLLDSAMFFKNRFGHYHLTRILEMHAAGDIYEAQELITGRRVTVNTLIKGDGVNNSARNLYMVGDADDNWGVPSEQSDERLKTAAEAAMRLDHPGIVKIHGFADTFDDEDNVAGFIASEPIDGHALKAFLDAGIRFGIADIVRIMGEILDALDHAHRNAVFHLDLNPANVLITRDGKVKLANFAIGKFKSAFLARFGAKPEHSRPPELRYAASGDGRTDVYSCGAILKQLLDGASSSTFEPPDANAMSKREFDSIVDKAMAGNPEQRFQARSFADALRRVGRAIAAKAVPGDAASRHQPRSQNYRESGIGRNFGDCLAIPARIGKYDIADIVAIEAFGDVYGALDPATGERVIVKAIRKQAVADNPELLARFRNRATASIKFKHSDMVKILEWGESDDLAFIVTECAEGRTLKDLFNAGVRFGDVPVDFMYPILAALEHAHDNGLTHLEITPSNVIFIPEQRSDDWDWTGLYSKVKIDPTASLLRPRSSVRMSPEQILGLPTDALSDVFACGMILYQLLTGSAPFGGTGAERARRIIDEEPAMPSEIAPYVFASIEHCVAWAMAKKPEDRFQSAKAFADNLHHVVGGHHAGVWHCESGATESWSAIRESIDPSDYEDFIKAYPTGRQAEIAKMHLETLRSARAVQAPKD